MSASPSQCWDLCGGTCVCCHRLWELILYIYIVHTNLVSLKMLFPQAGQWWPMHAFSPGSWVAEVLLFDPFFYVDLLIGISGWYFVTCE